MLNAAWYTATSYQMHPLLVTYMKYEISTIGNLLLSFPNHKVTRHYSLQTKRIAERNFPPNGRQAGMAKDCHYGGNVSCDYHHNQGHTMKNKFHIRNTYFNNKINMKIYKYPYTQHNGKT